MAGLKIAFVTLSAAAMLAACDNGPSAVAQKQAAGTQVAAAAPPAADAPRVDHRGEPPKVLDGAAVWAATRRFSAEEGARRAFERNGEAFGAKSVDQFVKKAHAFVSHPPAGTQTLNRPNGDTLFYSPKDNVFAVADKEGAPKTMFKPDDGAAYWQEQKDRSTRRSARSGRDDDAA